MPRSRPYKVGLNERLKDPVYAVEYLNAARRESRGVELLALRDVVQAHKVSRIAKDAKLNRETLYRTLSWRGNPTMATLESILKPLGVDWEYRPASRRRVRTKQAASHGPSIPAIHNAAPQSRHLPDIPQGQSAAAFGKCSPYADYSGTLSSSATGSVTKIFGGATNAAYMGFQMPAFIVHATSIRLNVERYP